MTCDACGGFIAGRVVHVKCGPFEGEFHQRCSGPAALRALRVSREKTERGLALDALEAFVAGERVRANVAIATT